MPSNDIEKSELDADISQQLSESVLTLANAEPESLPRLSKKDLDLANAKCVRDGFMGQATVTSVGIDFPSWKESA